MPAQTTSDILKKVRKIEIRTTKLVNSLFGGEYHSVFKGQGIEFADVREYVPGDDIRSIDWNVTARSQSTFIKKYVEEREMTVFFVVDMSGSQYFGSLNQLKSEIAAEITAVLAFAAVQNNDKTGLVIGTEEVEKFIPVSKGRNHVLRVVREILGYQPLKKGTHLKKVLEYLYRVLTRTAVVFVISDFQDEGFEKNLKVLNQKHDVIAIHLHDPAEVSMPKAGLIELHDNETGKTRLIDSSSYFAGKGLEKKSKKFHENLDKKFKDLGIDKITISTEDSYIEPLIRFFKEREAKIR